MQELGDLPGILNLAGSVQASDILKDGMGIPAVAKIPTFGLFQTVAYAGFAANGMYLVTDVTFDEEGMLGRILRFFKEISGKTYDSTLVYPTEVHVPIFDGKQDLLKKTHIKVTTPGTCFGSKHQQYVGQEPVAYFRDGEMLEQGETDLDGADPCYPDGFISTFNQRSFKWTGFKATSPQSMVAEVKGIRMAFPTKFMNLDQDEWQRLGNGSSQGFSRKRIRVGDQMVETDSTDFKVFDEFETMGNELDAQLIFKRGLGATLTGKRLQLGINYHLQQQLFGLPISLDSILFAFIYQWGFVPPNSPKNGPAMQIGATSTFNVIKSDATQTQFTATYNMETFIPSVKDLAQVAAGNLGAIAARGFANLGIYLGLSSISMLEATLFARQLVDNGDAQLEIIPDKVKEAMESISVGDVVFCFSPAKETTFVDGNVCPIGVGFSMSMNMFEIQTSLKLQMELETGGAGRARKFKKFAFTFELQEPSALVQRVIDAMIARITNGNEFFENILQSCNELLDSVNVNSVAAALVAEKSGAKWSKPTIAFSMSYTIQGNLKSIGLDLSGPVQNIGQVLKSAGQAVLARAIGIMNFPPKDDGSSCLKNRHCKSGNCYLSMCQACSYHISKDRCQVSERSGEALGCQWESKSGNCNSWLHVSALACNGQDGCYWRRDTEDCGQFNGLLPPLNAVCKTNCNCQAQHGVKVGLLDYRTNCYNCHGQREIYGTGRCDGTWHGALAEGLCKPKKCYNLPNCHAGSTCTDSCTDEESPNPAWPSGHSDEMPGPDDATTLLGGAKPKSALDNVLLMAGNNRVSRAVTKNPYPPAMSVAELVELRDGLHAGNASTGHGPLPGDDAPVDLFEVIGLVLHECISGDYPSAHNLDENGHATAEASEHFDLALKSAEVALKKMGLKKAADFHKITVGQWRRHLAPALIDHLHSLAVARQRRQAEQALANARSLSAANSSAL